MKPFSRILLAALLLIFSAGTGFAARFETGTSFTLPAEETQHGDLYFAGTVARLDGRVEGSAIAGCQDLTVAGTVARNLYAGAQNVSVSGAVEGDILAFCATINVTGPVSGTVRAGAGSVFIKGLVGQDVLAGCRSLTIDQGAEVKGDVVTGCGTLNVAGIVRGNVRAAAGDVIVSGIVDGDLVVTVDDDLVLTEDARVFGSLRYRSEKELDIGNRDAVFGDIEFTPVAEKEDFKELKRFRPRPGLLATFLVPFAIISVLAALAIGFILIAVWKHVLSRAIDDSLRRFGRTVGFGALGLFAGPLALLVALLLVITIPASLIGMVLYFVFLYLSKLLAGMFLGRWLFRLFGGHTASVWLFAPVGIILVYALCAIPVIGWLFWLFSAIVGFGVLIELLAASRRT